MPITALAPPPKDGICRPHRGYPWSTWLRSPAGIALLGPLRNFLRPGDSLFAYDMIHTQRIIQNKETENYIPSERTRQNSEKELKETERSSLPDKELKVWS